MDTLTASLTAKEWDYIGNCLATRPYNEVAPLLAKLQQQLNGPAPEQPAVKPDAEAPARPQDLPATLAGY